MKKVFIISLLSIITSVSLFSQSEKQALDTIFLKSGEKMPVYKIVGVYKKQILCYHHNFSKEYSAIDVDKVEYVKRDHTSQHQDLDMLIQQDTISTTTKIKLEYEKLNKNKSEIDYKIGWMQYNLGEFYKQESRSQLFYAASTITGLIGATILTNNTLTTDTKKYQDNLKMAYYCVFASSGLGALGLIIHINSYKWIKRTSISPTINGLSVTLDLN